MPLSNPPEVRVRKAPKRRRKLWELGKPPEKLIYSLGREIVYRLATGDADITGNGFSAMFAAAVHPNAVDHKSPVGVADVSWEGYAWSVKTVQLRAANFNRGQVRLISGRNNPGYSMGMEEPMKNP